jgi:hypothetical protein
MNPLQEALLQPDQVNSFLMGAGEDIDHRFGKSSGSSSFTSFRFTHLKFIPYKSGLSYQQ